MFPWWNHWPVSQQIRSNGRWAVAPDRVSHSSLAHIQSWRPYEESADGLTMLMLNGLSDKPAEGLVPLAKSWLVGAGDGRRGRRVPRRRVRSGPERAFVVGRRGPAGPGRVDGRSPGARGFARRQSGPLDPALGRGRAPASRSTDGRPPLGRDVRAGLSPGSRATTSSSGSGGESTSPVRIVDLRGRRPRRRGSVPMKRTARRPRRLGGRSLVLAGPARRPADRSTRSEYAARRARLMEKIPDGAAVFLGASAPAVGRRLPAGPRFRSISPVSRSPNAFLIVDGRPEREHPVLHHDREARPTAKASRLDLVRNPKDVHRDRAGPSGRAVRPLSWRACASGPGSSTRCSSPRSSARRTPTRSSTPCRRR